jgi:hypothetical protein
MLSELKKTSVLTLGMLKEAFNLDQIGILKDQILAIEARIESGDFNENDQKSLDFYHAEIEYFRILDEAENEADIDYVFDLIERQETLNHRLKKSVLQMRSDIL